MLTRRQPTTTIQQFKTYNNSNYNSDSSGKSNLLQGKKFYFNDGVTRQEYLRDLINSHGGKKELSPAQSNYYVCEGDSDINGISIDIPIIFKSYIISCLERGRPLNEELLIENNYRLVSSIFEGFVVASSGFEEEESALKKIIHQMSGRFSHEVNSSTTHLITKNALSKKTIEARKFKDKHGRPRIKIVKEDWPRESHIHGRDLSEECKIPIFYECKICLSGFNTPESRNSIQTDLTENGAIYQPDLKQSVQILVSNGTQSKKFVKAHDWGRPVVSEKWVYDSIHYGVLQDIEPYRIGLDQSSIYSTSTQSFSSSPIATGGGGGGFQSGSTHHYHHATPMPRNVTFTPISYDSQQYQQQQQLQLALLPQQQQQQRFQKPLPVSQHQQQQQFNQNVSSLIQPFCPPLLLPQSQQQLQPQPLQTVIAVQDEESGEKLYEIDYDIFRDATFGMLGFEGASYTKLRTYIDRCSNFVDYSSVPQTAYSTPCNLHYLLVQHGHRYKSETRHLIGTKIVSAHWFSACIHKKKILDPEQFIHYQPVKEIKFMPELRVTCSGYSSESEEFQYISELTNLMGGIFSKVLKKDITHLVTSSGSGQKYEIAKKKPTVKIVTLDWLTKCISEGKRVPEEDFIVKEGVNYTCNFGKQQSMPPPQNKNRNSILVKKTQPQPQNNSHLPLPQNQSPIIPQTNDSNIISPSLPISYVNNTQQNNQTLKGITIYLSETLKLDLKTQLTVWIEKMGGVVASDHFANITHYLTERIDMEEKRKILGNFKAVTPTWIKDIFHAGVIYDEDLYVPLLPEKKEEDDDNEHGILQSLSREPRSQLFTGSAPDSLRTKTGSQSKDPKEDIMDVDGCNDKEKENKNNLTPTTTTNSTTATTSTQQPNHTQSTQPSSIGKIVAVLEALPSQSQFSIPNPKKTSSKNIATGKKGVKRSSSGGVGGPTNSNALIINNNGKSSMSLMEIENLAEGFNEDSESSDEDSNSSSSDDDENSQRVTYGVVKRRKSRDTNNKMENGKSQISTSNSNVPTLGRPTQLANILKGNVKLMLFSAFDGKPPEDVQLALQSAEIGFRICETFITGKTTHLVTPIPKRSEKYMSACAAGCWILTPKFMYACIQHQECVDESLYEWTKARCTEENVKPAGPTLNFAEAARNCRIAVAQKKRGIFSKAVIRVLKYEDPKKSLDLWAGIIRSGGGIVYMDGDQIPSGTVITHILYKKNANDRNPPVEPNIHNIFDSDLTNCLHNGVHLVND